MFGTGFSTSTPQLKVNMSRVYRYVSCLFATSFTYMVDIYFEHAQTSSQCSFWPMPTVQFKTLYAFALPCS